MTVVNKHNVSVSPHYKVLELKDDDTDIQTFVFVILNKEDFNRGVNFLSHLLESKQNNYIEKTTNPIKVLVGGGDGTVLSIIESLHSLNIDIKRCVFGHIPLGTGNDLSNTLGFGCKATH